MSHRKDISKCSSATDLHICAMQNAIITFIKQERLTNILEDGKYIYHSALSKSLSDTANIHMVMHAFLEINRYCFEHNDCAGELINLFASEYQEAIKQHGVRIHQCKLKKHGRKFHSKKK
ncbi:MAG: hypothetical protein KBT33_06415 [Prevotellaceae bacterium]|nr:hypothetical protein [Candidatus Minthosoma equi]